MDRHAPSRALLGTQLFAQVENARVLMVGAGGIGCELLKNLAMLGFGHIELVDLDTIDVTNLNRQFLFQRQHVSQSKAHVARESALRFNPNIAIISHHGNIKDPQFDLAWFKSFDVVFNALDNLDARRHVNLMCVAGKVPLIDAGTAGYSGQSTIIQPGITECYDCHPKPTPKTFPVCTIRSTPSAPIHCIVWAKNFLFPQLFGEDEDEGDANQVNDTTNAKQVQELAREAQALRELKQSAGLPGFAERVLVKIYRHDIERLLGMEGLWQMRQKPVPLDVDALIAAANALRDPLADEMAHRRVMTLEETIKVFLQSTAALAKRYAASGPQSFDKDDDAAMFFVSAAANLRCHVYQIALKTFFEIKSMAGNIVPIVATTNGVIAGLMVLHALQVFEGRVMAETTDPLTAPPAAQHLVSRPNQVLARDKLFPPLSSCAICARAYVQVAVETASTTLGDLLEAIAETFSDLPVDNVTVLEGARMLYDPDFDDNLGRTLADLNVPPHHAFLLIDAYDQDDQLVQPLSVYIQKPVGKGGNGVAILGDVPHLWTKPAPPKVQDVPVAGGDESDGEVVMAVDDDDEDIIMTECGADNGTTETSTKPKEDADGVIALG
ncbi:E1 ubiquitin-activating protein uba2 [Allomyces arbusculus]|nr:E1 ubiquitin-activating protein uba2 [Allomyces arbusculus]